MAGIEPDMLLETRVYHTGKKRYIDVIKIKTGAQNKTAIGKPAINLARMLFCRSLSFSQ